MDLLREVKIKSDNINNNNSKCNHCKIKQRMLQLVAAPNKKKIKKKLDVSSVVK